MSVLESMDTGRPIANFSAERQGYEFDGIEFILSDVAGSTAVAQLYNAMTDINIPLIGSDLSLVDLDLAGCWLRSLDAEILSPGKVKVILHYAHSPVEQLVIEAGSALNQVSTNKDIDDIPISLEYTYPDPYPQNPSLAGETVTQGGTFTKQVPERILTYQLREPNLPQSFAHLYEGKVNDAPWQNGEASTWLLTSITGRSDNSGTDYLNFYTFQHRKDLWDPEVVFIAVDGKPPPDVVEDTGQKVVISYAEFDFTTLFPG